MNKKRRFTLFLILLLIILIFTDTYFGRYIRWFLPDVYDLNKFPNERVENGDNRLIIPKRQSDLVNSIIPVIYHGAENPKLTINLISGGIQGKQ